MNPQSNRLRTFQLRRLYFQFMHRLNLERKHLGAVAALLEREGFIKLLDSGRYVQTPRFDDPSWTLHLKVELSKLAKELKSGK